MSKIPFSKPVKKQTLAEQMADAIQESILAGDLEPGEPLPTEPELAEIFEVSRAVVRDATRMLMALGLVDVQHGRGMFVTHSQVEAFGDALLLALQRAGATVWDVEQFEQLMFPEVVALATEVATEEELTDIQQAIEDYLETFAAYQKQWQGKEPPTSEQIRLRESSRQVTHAIFEATHNQVLKQLAMPLLKLRNLREWADTDDEPTAMITTESAYFQRLLEALTSRDPDQAHATVRDLMQLPSEAVKAMCQTPVGEIPVIPVVPNNK